MPARKKSAASRKRPRRKTSKSRRLRWRLGAAFVSVAFVATAAFGIYLYATVGARFEGRLWATPSRIYSAGWELYPGAPATIEATTERLARCGYALSEATPQKPGQYRRQGSTLEVVLRPSETLAELPPRGRIAIRFGDRRIRSIRDDDGRRLDRIELEPELLATLYGVRQEERTVVQLEQIPDHVIQAVLSAEDTRYRSHIGVDLRSVLRAAVANTRSGKIVQGGSTITQQTVKNLFLDQRRTWWRKLRELPMALMLDWRYSKDRILEVYLNEIYMGQRGPVAICGVQAASRFYFGRDVKDLSVSDAALLAGLIQSPGRHNPFKNLEGSRDRRDQVLEAMLRGGYLNAAGYERAKAEPIVLGSGKGGYARAPYAVDYVNAELSRFYPADVQARQGLRITTSIDTMLQEAAEQALVQGLERLERDYPAVKRQLEKRSLQGAVLVTRPETGEILAMVGGRDYKKSQFNRAYQARRQPGSCFKPFVYATGFENGAQNRGSELTAASLIEDGPIELTSGGKRWTPKNYDGEYRGPVTARRALEDSLNVPTIRAARHVGLERIVELARRAGIRSALRPLPSLALGTMEVSPLELATAYGTLAELGAATEPAIVREIRDDEGRLVYARQRELQRAMEPSSAFLTTHLLEGVFERGTARRAYRLGFRGRAAGKTGTTDDTRDAWFVGYTPRLLALVWVGYDDNARTGLTGSTGALPIWVDLMKRSGMDSSYARFAAPPGIVREHIDPETGGLAVAGCRRATSELFLEGTEPDLECREHRRGWARRWFRRDPDRDRRRERDRPPDI